MLQPRRTAETVERSAHMLLELGALTYQDKNFATSDEKVRFGVVRR